MQCVPRNAKRQICSSFRGCITFTPRPDWPITSAPFRSCGIRNPNLHGPARLTKRVFDIVVAAAASIMLLPVLVAAALAVRI